MRHRGQGVVDYLHTFATTGSLPDSLAPYVSDVAKEEDRDGRIRLMAAGNVLSGSLHVHRVTPGPALGLAVAVLALRRLMTRASNPLTPIYLRAEPGKAW